MISFPGYIPQCIQKYVLSALQQWPKGQLELEAKIESLTLELQKPEKQKIKDAEIDQIQEQRRLLDVGNQKIASQLKCMRLLIQDERMEDVYNKLHKILEKEQEQFSNEHKQFVNEQEQLLFFCFACNVDDYTPEIQKIKDVQDLTDEIGKAAGKLSSLLDDINKLAYIGDHHQFPCLTIPVEFTELSSLIENTVHNDGHPSDQEWQKNKTFILPKFSENNSKLTAEELFYIWNSAPSVHSIIKCLEDAAREFKVSNDFSPIKSALSSRKDHKPSQYIRALYQNLVNADIKVTDEIIKAIAICANVVLDDSEKDIQASEVNRVIKGL